MPTHLSLFSGIGGLDLAAEWAGFRTVGQCEFADYPTKVLEKHWPNVPRWRDIRTLTGDDFYKRTGLRTVDIISGGFPCQQMKTAGKRKGEADDRFLWPEMLRVIKELNPSWVLGENVDGLLSAKFDETLRDIVGGLEAAGYYVRVFSFEAAQVGAPHRRRRTFIVGYNSNFDRLRTRQKQTISERPHAITGRICDDVAHTLFNGLQGCGGRQIPGKFEIPFKSVRSYRVYSFWYNWSSEPDVGRVANGIPCWLDEPAGVPRVAVGVKDRVSRIKGLGNAVVPQQAYPIFSAIYEIIESEAKHE